MIAVPPDIMARFQVVLDQKPVLKRYQAYYKKWLRFYWDFCHKYQHSVSMPENLRPFVEKLRHKKQKDFQIRQASDAISLFYEIVKQSSSALRNTGQNSNRKALWYSAKTVREETQQTDRRVKTGENWKSTFDCLRDEVISDFVVDYLDKL